jgi:hypothetical protein
MRSQSVTPVLKNTKRITSTEFKTELQDAREQSGKNNLLFLQAVQTCEQRMQQLARNPISTGGLPATTGDLQPTPAKERSLPTFIPASGLALQTTETRTAGEQPALAALEKMVATIQTSAAKTRNVANEDIARLRLKGKEQDNYFLSELTSSLVILSPLAAVEAAIIHHLDLYRMMPDTIFVAESVYKALEEQHERVKFSPFTGVYHYYAGSRTISLAVKKEQDFPRWWLGINQDQIYCCTF